MRLILLLAGVAISLMTNFAIGQTHASTPQNGYVPDADTAIRIAVAVWTPIYGEKRIRDEKPYHAVLKNGVWIVEGSMPANPTNQPIFGGVARIEIAKSDGRVLNVEHGE